MFQLNCRRIFCALILLLGCFASAKDRDSVRVGYFYVPNFQEGNENSELRGYAYEYYQRVAQYTGWHYRYVFGSSEDLYKKLLSGEIDLLAGFSYQKNREGLVSYPSLPMGNTDYYLLKNVGNTHLNEDYQTLEGKKLGVLGGVSEANLREFLEKNKISASVKVYKDIETRNHALKADSVDAILVESISLKPIDDTEVFIRTGEMPFYLTVNINRPDLLKELNIAQNHLKETEPLLLGILHEKYLRSNSASRTLTSIEKKWINTHDTLRVGYLKNLLPYSDSKVVNGKVLPDGIVTEIFPEILRQLNQPQINLKYTAYENYDQLISAITNGSEDVVFPIGEGIFIAEQNGFYQSIPVIESELDLIFKGEFGGETFKSFAVNKQSRMMAYRIKETFPKSEIKEYDSIEECLEAVMDGRASATMLGNLRSIHIMKKRKYAGLSVKLLDISNNKYFGVANNDDGLLKILNRGLSLTGPDFALNASFKYSEKLYQPGFLDKVSDNAEFVIIALLILGIVSIFIFGRRFIRIKKQAAHEKDQNERLSLQLDVIKTISNLYHSVFLVDVKHNSFKIFHTFGALEKAILPLCNQAQTALNNVARSMIKNQYREKMMQFHNIQYWTEILKDNDSHSEEYEGIVQGWCRSTILVAQRNLKGDPTHVIYISQQINQQKEIELNMQEALIRAERASNAKSDFLNNMSHDIRTPMNAIIGFTTLASAHIDDKDRLTDYLDKINTSSQHLLSLINDVLDMRRIESGKVKLERHPVYLPDLLQEIETIVQHNAQRKQQTLTFDAHHVTHQNCFTDSLRLRQVLLNLLSNAIKFTREKGVISLKVEEKVCNKDDYAHYEFRVKDNGIGMSKEFQSHIFEAFSREESTTVSGIQGTGLGTAITKKIVDMMGGTIEIESEEDYGTEFIVNLEFKLCDVRASKTETQSSKSHFKNTKILLAEDNSLNQEIAITILTEAGIEVDVAENGQVAVQKIVSEPANTYKAILMDIQMPIMDGYEATRRIRQIPNSSKSNIPIIAMTANAFEEDKKKALNIGMNGYLAKPIDLDKLMSTLSAVL